MSPLWRDEIGIYIAPTKVVLARMQKGVRPRCVMEDGETVEPANWGDWQPALDALSRHMQEDDWHDANARVVVSDHWTRYAELPWSPALASAAERELCARHVMQDTFGDIADQWVVAVSRALPGQTAIVSAMPIAFIEELKAVFAAQGIKLLSIQPHLLVAFNAWRDKLPGNAAWFAAIDDGMLAALHVTNGRCDRVRAVRISGDWSVEMRRMQKMGRLARGNPAEGPVFIDAPVGLREATPDGDGNAALEWLQDHGEPANIAHRVAMLKGLYA